MARAVIAAYFLQAAVFAAQSVDGHVVDAITGAGIPGVNVLFVETSGHSEIRPYRATTDSGGRFHMAGVTGGVYKVACLAKGYWTPPEVTQPTYSISDSSEPLRFDARLEPIPRLSGRVIDPDGKPVAKSHVWLIDQNRPCYTPGCFMMGPQLTTGEDGEFSTTEFRVPGTWFVGALPPPSYDLPHAAAKAPLAWVETFYPNVPLPELAAEIAVRPGIALPFVEIKLSAAPAHRVRGRVLDAQGKPAPNLAITLYNGFGEQLQQTTADNGAFEFQAVTPGQWRLTATRTLDAKPLWGVQSVEVRDRNVDQVTLRLQKAIEIHGHFVLDRPDGAPGLNDDPPDIAAMRDLDSFGTDQTMPYAPLGHSTPALQFDIKLYPGQYRFTTVEPPQPPYYVDAIRLGEVNVLTLEGAAVSDGDQPLTIVLKYGGGTVRGAIENCNGGRAVLFPTDPALLNVDFIREAKCGPNGQFEIPNIRPGDYYGFALTSGFALDRWRFLSDAALKPQATRITVRDGETTNADIRILQAR